MMDFLKGSVTPKDWMAVGVILGIAAVLVIAFTLVIHPAHVRKLEDIADQNERVIEDLRLARDKEARLEELDAAMASTQQLIDEFERRLPNARQIPNLTREFEDLAAQVGLEVKLSTEPRLKDERKETIPFQILARGTFHQIAGFINRLEKFERYLKISDLKIGEQKMGVAEAEFTLSTFRFLEAGPGEKP